MTKEEKLKTHAARIDAILDGWHAAAETLEEEHGAQAPMDNELLERSRIYQQCKAQIQRELDQLFETLTDEEAPAPEAPGGFARKPTETFNAVKLGDG